MITKQTCLELSVGFAYTLTLKSTPTYRVYAWLFGGVGGMNFGGSVLPVTLKYI